MRKKRKLFLTTIVLFLIFSFISFYNAKAVYDNGDGIIVGIRIDVSKDGGNTWYNYMADENPGNQTLTVSPGDTLIFRGTSWNAGALDAGVAFEGIITNTEYIDTFNAFEGGNEDVDGTGAFYTLNGINVVNDSMIMAIGLETHLDTTKDENDPELGSITLTLTDNIPDQTVITGTFELLGAVPYLVFNPFSTAYAQGALAESTVRILVENPEVEAEVQQEDTPETILEDLPQTGKENRNPIINLIVTSAILFTSSFALGFILKKSELKKQKN
ncbi:MAG: hypothetical protein PHN37_02875 [Candidatus Pacebacteria bacterium]|nr:hypothetical protein [Candidatus Paceibacterota bacterium]